MPPQTLTTWWEESSDIDFDPVYQRSGHIWPIKMKQDLVDTVLNGFDIPKLYVANFTLLDSPLNQGGKKYAVIDGKQRLNALFGFFAGEYALPKTFTYYEDTALELGGLSYKDLVNNYPRIARRFDNYPLTVVHVVTDDESKINELFLRLNASKPLTGAEVRNAMRGEVPAIIRDLVAHPFWSKIRFNTLRGQDKNAAAKLLLIEHTGTFVDTKKTQLDDLVRRANEAAETAARADGGATSIADVEDIERSTEEVLPESEEEAESLISDDLVEKVAETDHPDIGRSAMRVKRELDKLSNIFIERDSLLAQQAQLPVIYWLVREIKLDRVAKVRPFLQKFDLDRQENRRRDIGDPSRDLTLVDFEMLTRSSNDQGSIRGRYGILRRRFDAFTNWTSEQNG
ncbi:MAG: DUF262 domain-containing protein [Alphaproteobacteria bacterium]|nr:DUF262 domain-containing protein [Alphaproteobacteria bacterium]